MELGDFVRITEGLFTEHGVGKIISVADDGDCVISFFDKPKVPPIIVNASLENIQHVELIQGTVVYFEDSNGVWHSGKVLNTELGSSEVQFSNATLQTNYISNSDLFVRYAKKLDRPGDFLAEQLYSSRYLRDRRLDFIESYEYTRHLIGGLTGYFSASIELEEHQHKVIKTINNDAFQRYLLADEVGLGKTIEASSLIRQYVLDFPIEHSVVIVTPDHLVSQWKRELSEKFKLARFLSNTIQVVGFSDITDIQRYIRNAGMVVVDEVHNINSNKNEFLFKLLKEQTASLNRLLLLSATPVLHNEKLFHEILQILDPTLYTPDNFETFEAQLKNVQQLNEIISNLTPEGFLFINENMEMLRDMFPSDEKVAEYADSLFELSISGKEENDDAVINALNELRAYIEDAYKLENRILRNRRENVQGLTVERSLHSFLDVTNIQIERFINQLDLLIQNLKYADHARKDLSEVGAWYVEILSGFLLRKSKFQIRECFIGKVPKVVEHKHSPLLSELQTLFQEIDDNWIDIAIQKTLDELTRRGCSTVIWFCSGVESVSFISNFIKSSNTDFYVLELKEDVSDALVNLDSSNLPTLLICGGDLEEGLNLHGPNRTIVNFDIPLNPNRIEQRIGRVDRFGSVEFDMISVRNVSNELELKLHDINENILRIFQHSVASLQFSIERFYSELLKNLARDGLVAVDVLADNLLGPEGITKELNRIKQQEDLEGLVSRDDKSFSLIEIEDGNWRDFRQSTLAWSLDCLKFMEDPITPYFYVRQDFSFNNENEFWRKYRSSSLNWTTSSSLNKLSPMLDSKFTQFNIRPRFVPTNGTSEAFRGLRDGKVDFLVLTDDHVRRINPPIYAKRLGSGQVEGSEIKRMVFSNRANLSADQTLAIFRNFIDHNHHGNKKNSKAFKLYTEQYSFRRQTSTSTGTNLFCVGNEVVDGIRSASDAQMDGRSFVNWRHSPDYVSQKQLDTFICVSILISGDVQPSVEFASSSDERIDTNIKRAFQQKLDKFFKPRILNVWLNEEHLIVEDNEILNFLNKPYSQNLQTNGYVDLNVSRAVIAAVTNKYLNKLHTTWSSFVKNGEDIVSSAMTLDIQTRSDLTSSAERLLEDEKGVLRQKLVRSDGGKNLGLVLRSVDEYYENKIIELLVEGLRLPKLEVEAIGVLFVSPHPLPTGRGQNG